MLLLPLLLLLLLLLPPLLPTMAAQQTCNCGCKSAGVLVGNGQTVPVKAVPSAAQCCSHRAATPGWEAAFQPLDRELLPLKTDDGASAANCTQHAATGVTTGNDVGRPVNVKTVDACAQVCETTARCCIAEFDSHVGRC